MYFELKASARILNYHGHKKKLNVEYTMYANTHWADFVCLPEPF